MSGERPCALYRMRDGRLGAPLLRGTPREIRAAMYAAAFGPEGRDDDVFFLAPGHVPIGEVMTRADWSVSRAFLIEARRVAAKRRADAPQLDLFDPPVVAGGEA